MELWDIYDEYRQKTQKNHERGKPMKSGDYHLVVHIWITNDKGQYLIQKRQSWKEGYPDTWDCAAAGSAVAGDSSKEAAVRETMEEIGVRIEEKDLEPLFSIKFSRGFDDIYLVRKNISLTELKLQEEEVADAKWATEDEIKDMISKGEFVPYHYLDGLLDLVNSKVIMKNATMDDSDVLFELQKKVFMPLYKKYQDHSTSPANQPKDRFLRRFELGEYYKIFYETELVGSVFVYLKEPGLMKLHIVNILQDYQNKGIAQQVMERLELLYPQAKQWELETIKSEERNLYLYEKMGYVQQDNKKIINDKLHIVTYIKDKGIKTIQGY